MMRPSVAEVEKEVMPPLEEAAYGLRQEIAHVCCLLTTHKEREAQCEGCVGRGERGRAGREAKRTLPCWR